MNEKIKLKEKWQKRFDFFDKYGTNMLSSEFKIAYKKLPLSERLNIGLNWWAFFFGPLYYFVLGAWRKAISAILITLIILISCTILAIEIDISNNVIDKITTGIGFGFAAFWASIANKINYLHKIKHSTSWNPFE